MPDLLTDLARVRELMERATPGPWKAGGRSVSAPETDDRLGLDLRLHGGNQDDNRANARLIVAMHDLLRTHASGIEAMARHSRYWLAWCDEAEKHGAGLAPLLDDAKHMGAGVFELHLRGIVREDASDGG